MSDWFDRVTGSNDYERQSWRDNYNGGQAAGDWTGNVNASLAAERESFGGATWSGSSSEPSALQLAQSYVGHASVSTGTGSTGGGVGNGATHTGVSTETGPGNVGAGAGNRIVISGNAPLTSKFKDSATGGYAGVKFEPNPWFSDVGEWWEPRAGEPGEWIGGIVTISADAVYNSGRLVDWATGSDIVSGARKDTAVSRQDDGAWPEIAGAFTRQFGTWDRQFHEVVGGGKPYVGGGF